MIVSFDHGETVRLEPEPGSLHFRLWAAVETFAREAQRALSARDVEAALLMALAELALAGERAALEARILGYGASLAWFIGQLRAAEAVRGRPN